MKLREYQAIPSVRAYVMVGSDAAAVTVPARDQDGDMLEAAGLTEADRLDLAAIGVSAPAAALYAGSEFATVAIPKAIAGARGYAAAGSVGCCRRNDPGGGMAAWGSGWALLAACGVLCGCAATAPDPAHPRQAAGWVETRLYFGLGPADRPTSGIGEAGWRDFLDREVTPRFPDGLSVIDAYGQWQGPGQAAPERLHSKLLVIEHPDDAADTARIEAIRAAWKRRTGDRSVLRVDEPAAVSF